MVLLCYTQKSCWGDIVIRDCVVCVDLSDGQLLIFFLIMQVAVIGWWHIGGS